ncbi:MAG: CDP-alcohol phosphatidyltransferase family protein [Candidatus Bipolaricaulota bacterium]|nr:CDP-alcohol phosphatidyltransferase family protein [Candidatus Bipolaricaulota bacterium]
MTRKDRIPDWLTGARALVALAILALIPWGPSALRTVAFLLLLGWTTDMVDGRLARRWDKDPTWIGEHEFHIDMVMVLASAIYLVLAGLVPPLPGAAYLLGATGISLALLRWSGDFLRFKSVTMLLACPWVFAPFVVGLVHDPVVVYAGLIWTAAALVLDWRRFLGVVGDFLAGARAFLRR